MPNFRYRALTQNGEIVNGTISAPTSTEVGRRIEYLRLLPIETIEDKLKTVLKLRSATVNDIPVLMHMARALAEQQGLAPLMTATAAGWRRDLGQAFDATVAAIKNKPVDLANGDLLCP